MDLAQGGQLMSSQQRATHARVIRLKTEPASTDQAIREWTSGIFPLLKKQDGFRGATLVGNRKTGEGLSVTYWESEEAMKNARPNVRPQGETILAKTGSKMVDEDECEVAVLERIQPPKAGVFVRVTTADADPAKAAEGIAFYEEKIVPVIRKQPGARMALLFVNRKTGRTLSASGWDTQKDLEKSEAAVTGLREEAIKKIGGKSSKVEVFEVYFTEILTPVAAAR
jgi:antibiotic biosynthesis monooxygenase